LFAVDPGSPCSGAYCALFDLAKEQSAVVNVAGFPAEKLSVSSSLGADAAARIAASAIAIISQTCVQACGE